MAYKENGTLQTDRQSPTDETVEISDWGAAQLDGLLVENGVLRLKSAIPQSGGTHQWNTDEGSGSTLADSISGMDGTINTATWKSGNGTGSTHLEYTNNEEHIDLGTDSITEFDHFISGPTGTFFAWVKLDSQTGLAGIFGNSFTNNSDGFGFGRDGDSWIGGTIGSFTSGGTVTTGSWIPVAFVLDSGSFTIYSGDPLSEEVTGTVSTTASIDSNVKIGAVDAYDGSSTYPNSISGDIDIAWTDSVARTQSELQSFVDDSAGFYESTTSSTKYSTKTVSTSSPKSLAITGDYAVVVGQGLSMIDISSPEGPSEVATLSDTELQGGYGVAATSNYAYVAGAADDQFIVYDISDKTNPTRVADLAISWPRKVTKDGNYVYVTTDNSQEYHSIDVSDPTNPTIADTLTDSDLDYVFESAIIGNTALICARGTGKLVLVDVSDPTALSKAGTWSDADLTDPYGIVIDETDSEAFITCAQDNLVMSLDVSTPTSPSKLGTFNSSQTGNLYGMDIYNNSDTIAVSARDSCHVTTINVTDPSTMDQTGYVSTNGSSSFGPYDTAVSGDYTFTVVRGTDEFVVSGAE